MKGESMFVTTVELIWGAKCKYTHFSNMRAQAVANCLHSYILVAQTIYSEREFYGPIDYPGTKSMS